MHLKEVVFRHTEVVGRPTSPHDWLCLHSVIHAALDEIFIDVYTNDFAHHLLVKVVVVMLVVVARVATQSGV
jgi:hypothetical protein